MPLSPCAACARIYVGKMPAFYFGWYDQSGVRQSYRVKLCPPCVVACKFDGGHAVPVKDGYMQLAATCGECGGPIDSLSITPLYATVYGPDGRADLAYMPCAECAEVTFAWVVEHGEALDDRPQPAVTRGAGRGAPKR